MEACAKITIFIDRREEALREMLLKTQGKNLITLTRSLLHRGASGLELLLLCCCCYFYIDIHKSYGNAAFLPAKQHYNQARECACELPEASPKRPLLCSSLSRYINKGVKDLQPIYILGSPCIVGPLPHTTILSCYLLCWYQVSWATIVEKPSWFHIEAGEGRDLKIAVNTKISDVQVI